MDERRDRRRAFHRIREPDVQRHLRRLAHRAYEQADADQRHRVHAVGARQREGHLGDARGDRERIAVIERRVAEQARAVHHARDAEHEAEVADAVHDERLHVREDRGRALEPEADEQVTHDAHRFPAEEQLHEVVGHHEHQHREREQRDVAEEAVVARIVVHVADRVDVHAQRHEGHDDHHQRSQLVDEEADFHPDAVADQPLVDGRVVGRGAVEEDRFRDDGRQDQRDADARDRDGMRDPAGKHAAEQSRDHRRDERRERNGEQQVRVQSLVHAISPSGCSGLRR
jgi:hypothetical protein